MVPVSIHSVWVKGKYIFVYAPIVFLCSTWALFCLCCILVFCFILSHFSFISLFFSYIYIYIYVCTLLYLEPFLPHLYFSEFFSCMISFSSPINFYLTAVWFCFFSKSDIQCWSTCKSHSSSSSKLSSECAFSRHCFVLLSPSKSMLDSFLE